MDLRDFTIVKASGGGRDVDITARISLFVFLDTVQRMFSNELEFWGYLCT